MSDIPDLPRSTTTAEAEERYLWDTVVLHFLSRNADVSPATVEADKVLAARRKAFPPKP